ERRIEEVGVEGPRPMVEEATDYLYSQLVEPFQPFVRPGEVAGVGRQRSDAFPEDRITHFTHAQRCEHVDIERSVAVARLGQLIAPAVADPDDRAFGAGPELQRRLLH